MDVPTLSQAIRDAIEAELAAERFYAGLAVRADHADARSFFRAMALREGLHAETLRAQFATWAGFPDHGADRPLAGVESLPTWEPEPGMTLSRALDLARDCEAHAAGYYHQLSQALPGELATFFLEMSRAELDHVAEMDRIRAVLGA